MNVLGMEEQTKLPVGVTKYRKICEGGYYYVDKTLLVKELMDNGSEVTLFSRPRRFGKSLNMDMLRVFFEMSDDNTARYFEDKMIWKCGPSYTDMQSKYPVIYLSFRDIEAPRWEVSRALLIASLREEYGRHLRNMDVERLPEDMHEMIRSVRSGAPDDASLYRALRDLTLILHEYHGVAPIVLIDEYDTPIEAAWDRGYYRDMMDFMSPFLKGALKDNEHLSFACMSGVLQLAKEGLFSGLNHVKVNNVLSNAYDEFFGFTPEEVRAMAVYYGVPEKYEEIQEWYEGYRFGAQEVFNPWSVIMYFDSGCEAQSYWTNTSRYEAIGHVLDHANAQVAEGLLKVLNDGSVWSVINPELVYPNIDSAEDEKATKAVFSLLLMAGYLTTTGNTSGGRRNSNTSELELVIPNEELRDVYHAEILEHVAPAFPKDLRKTLQTALLADDPESAEKILSDLLNDSVSYYDLGSEKAYHVWLLGLLMCFPGYRITSNRESGAGRYDLCLSPRDKSGIGVLIEVKRRKNLTDKSMEELAQEAIKQIRKKEYAGELRAQGVQNILEFGVAFFGKHAHVVSGTAVPVDKTSKE